MEMVFWRVLAVTAASSAAALVILAVRALFYRVLPKAFVSALWCVLLVRMLLPFGPPSGLSLFNLPGLDRLEEMPARQTEEMTSSAPALPERREEPPGGRAPGEEMPREGSSPEGGESDPLEEEAPSKAAGSTSSGRIPWAAAAGVVWAAGAAAVLLFSAGSYIGTSLKLRRHPPVRHPVVEACIRKSRLKRKVTVYQSALFSTPVVCGLLHPRILLPEQTDWEDHVLLAQVVNHELAHIRRWDALFKMLSVAALSLHWFNPLLWYCWRLAMRDMELAVDERVLEQSRTDIRKMYAESLVSMAASQRGGGLGGGILSFGESGIRTRVKAVMRHRKVKAWMICAGALLTAVCCAVLLTNAKGPGVWETVRNWQGTAEAVWPESGQSRRLSEAEARAAAGLLTREEWKREKEEPLSYELILRLQDGPVLKLSPGEDGCRVRASWRGESSIYLLPEGAWEGLWGLLGESGGNTPEQQPTEQLPAQSAGKEASPEELQRWWEEYLCYASMTMMDSTFGGEFSAAEDLPQGAMDYVWYQLCRHEPEYGGSGEMELLTMPREKAMEYARKYLNVTDERFVTEDVNYDAAEDGILCFAPYRLDYTRYRYDGRGEDAPEGSPRQNLEPYALQSVRENEDGSFTAVVEDYRRVSYWDSRDRDAPDILWYFSLEPGEDGVCAITSLRRVYVGKRQVSAEGSFTPMDSLGGIPAAELVSEDGYGNIFAREWNGRFVFVRREEEGNKSLVTIDPKTLELLSVLEYPGEIDRLALERLSEDGRQLLVRENRDLVFYDGDMKETGRFAPQDRQGEFDDVTDDGTLGAYTGDGNLWICRMEEGEYTLLAQAPNPSGDKDTEAYSGGRFVLGGTHFLARRVGWEWGYGYHLFDLDTGELVRSIDVSLGYHTEERIGPDRLTVLTLEGSEVCSSRSWELSTGAESGGSREGVVQSETSGWEGQGAERLWFFSASSSDPEQAQYRLCRWNCLTGEVEPFDVTVRGAIPVILASGNGRVVFGYSYGGQAGLAVSVIG